MKITQKLIAFAAAAALCAPSYAYDSMTDAEVATTATLGAVAAGLGIGFYLIASDREDDDCTVRVSDGAVLCPDKDGLSTAKTLAAVMAVVGAGVGITALVESNKRKSSNSFRGHVTHDGMSFIHSKTFWTGIEVQSSFHQLYNGKTSTKIDFIKSF